MLCTVVKTYHNYDSDNWGDTMREQRDTRHYTYDRTWEEIENMLDKAERLQNRHRIATADDSLHRSKQIYHARQFKALEGVVKALKWCLGDKDVDHPLE